MSKEKILIVWSNYYDDLAKKQLDSCLNILNESEYNYDVENVCAGVYEIPVVIQYYHKNNPYTGYLPLGLLLKGETDHYQFIFDHIKECFIKFAMDGIMLGNGIITANTQEILTQRVYSQERVKEAFRALNYLIHLKERLN